MTVASQLPTTPLVQHWMFAGPGQKPGVLTPAHRDTSTQVPDNPPTLHPTAASVPDSGNVMLESDAASLLIAASVPEASVPVGAESLAASVVAGPQE